MDAEKIQINADDASMMIGDIQMAEFYLQMNKIRELTSSRSDAMNKFVEVYQVYYDMLERYSQIFERDLDNIRESIEAVYTLDSTMSREISQGVGGE